MKYHTYRQLFLGTLLVISALLFTNCNKDKDPTPEEQTIEKIIAETPIDPYTIAKKLVDQAGWPEEVELDFELGTIQLLNYKREVVKGDIVHYSFDLAVGTHQYDKIGVHRVVKETAANTPLKTSTALFFQHGDLKNFTGMMLPSTFSPSMPEGFGLATYLAENDVDVWGIDQAWCAVPAGVTDFSFFKDFGLDKATRDLRNAMAVARIARYLTGNGLDALHMAGYSSGMSTVYAVADMETQMETGLRHAKTLIPIDMIIKSDQAFINELWDQQLALSQEPWDMGQYESYLGFTFLTGLALSDPGGPSPVFEGFTNLQVMLFYGCANIAGAASPFHYWAAEWVNDFPSTPKYTTWEQIMDFTGSAIEYQPHKFWIDYNIMLGNSHDSPYDDHLGQIKLPIYNVAAGGGFGNAATYGASLTGSTDVTHKIVALDTPENALYDFGHVDLFTASNAPGLWWGEFLGWLEAH
ncbi:MAG: hypothetical protein WA004_15290 [Saprospiraceae bacterium]